MLSSGPNFLCIFLDSVLSQFFFVYLAAPGVSQIGGPFQSSAALLEPGYIYRPDSSSVPGNPIPDAALSSWSYNSVPPVSVSQVTKGIICFMQYHLEEVY